MNNEFRKPLVGTSLEYFDARAAVNAIKPNAWDGLPYTARIHAENIVRKADPGIITDCLVQLIERRRDRDFPALRAGPPTCPLTSPPRSLWCAAIDHCRLSGVCRNGQTGFYQS